MHTSRAIVHRQLVPTLRIAKQNQTACPWYFPSTKLTFSVSHASASVATLQANQVVLDALNRCIAACEMCADACLHEDHVQMMVPCIELDRDCADICRLTAACIARNSAHAQPVIKECIETCQKCATECGQHQHDHCQHCAEACRQCVEACRQYSA